MIKKEISWNSILILWIKMGQVFICFLKIESIGIDELEEPLISLGIAETRDDVSKLVYSVDNDG